MLIALVIGITDARYRDPRTRNQQFTGPVIKAETNGADDLVRVTRDVENPAALSVGEIQDSQTEVSNTKFVTLKMKDMDED